MKLVRDLKTTERPDLSPRNLDRQTSLSMQRLRNAMARMRHVRSQHWTLIT